MGAEGATSWWVAASGRLLALFPSSSPRARAASPPRAQRAASPPRLRLGSQVQPRKGKPHHAWGFGKNSKARTSRSTATGIKPSTVTESSNSQVTVGGQQFPKEVVVAHVDYCRRASVCEKNHRVCHMCVFIEERCRNCIVKESELIIHCRRLHSAIVVECEAPGCSTRAMTHEDLELHSYFCHIQAQGWWRQYQNLELGQ